MEYPTFYDMARSEEENNAVNLFQERRERIIKVNEIDKRLKIRKETKREEKNNRKTYEERKKWRRECCYVLLKDIKSGNNYFIVLISKVAAGTGSSSSVPLVSSPVTIKFDPNS
jgi:galactokinase/mevalonate kinase-like predicted kinase